MLIERHASARDLDGVIDLERLRSGSSTSLERDASRFLELTWPSSDVHALIGGLSHRFNGGSQAGTILAHSAKGLGKSHALLLGCHLFSSPLHAGMDAFSRFGTNFHEREGRFFFDSEENEYAKVELEAVKLNDEPARAELVRIWHRDVFRDTRHSVVFQDPATTRQTLEALDRKPPRYVLAPRRLSAPERHGLYTGLERRNQILLLEPRDARVDHLANPDMLALAHGIRAAAQLAESASSGERRNRFERIAKERTQEIVRLLKSAGLVYVRIDEWAEAPDRTVFEEESLGSASTREEVLTFLRIRIFPDSLFEEHHTIDAAPGPLLLWSRFPDQRYTDSTAVDETLYDAPWDGLELAWQRTVQAVPLDRPVLVTSDHGYVFLGAGLSDPSLKGVDRPLEGKRFRTFGPDEALPASRPGLWVDRKRRLAMLAGRCHNRPQAPSASRSVYRHGGLTLMEMLTPWLVLEPATCTAGDGARGEKSKTLPGGGAEL